MAKVKKRLDIGLILVPDNVALAGEAGEIKVSLSSQVIQAYLDGTTRDIITADQSQTLTNKTINSDNNTISNIANANIKTGAAIDASKIADGSVSNTEFQYLDGVTSAIQTQLNGKQATITGAASTITSSNLTANRAVTSDASGKITISTVTDTELGYLSGVSSSVQTQLNGKEPTITTLPISKGGTNSVTALNNNRVMQSSGGSIVEAAAITASRALISDANGIPTHSSVTSTELGYVSGVTSAVQTQINTKVTGPASATDNAVARYDLATGKLIQDSGVIIDDSNNVTGIASLTATSLNGTTTTSATTSTTGVDKCSTVNDTASGSSATLSTPTAPIIRLTNASLVSIDGIPAGQSGQKLILVNSTGVDVSINDNSGATTANRIYTGLKAAITLKDQASVMLQYDSTDSRWKLIGGTGGSGSGADQISSWNSYTPTLTGFGTATGIEIQYRRVGQNIEIRGKFTAGTTTATEARLSLPSGLTSAATGIIPSIQLAGYAAVSSNSADNRSVLIEPSVTYVTFGLGSSSTGALTKVNGTSFTTGDTISIQCSIPITGYTATGKNITSVNTNYTALATDQIILCNSTSGAFTVILPSAPSNPGMELTLIKTNSTLNKVTIDGNGSETIRGKLTVGMFTQNESWKLVSDGSNWQVTEHMALTDWSTPATWAASITATTTAPTLGTATVVQNYYSWRRVGRNIQIQYYFRKTATGTATAGSGDYLFPVLPSGVQIDTTLRPIENTVQGVGSYIRNGDIGRANLSASTLYIGSGWCAPYSSTQFTAGIGYVGGGGGATSVTIDSSGIGRFNVAADLTYDFNLDFPVNGWDE